MKLYEQWRSRAESIHAQEELDQYWQKYFEKETENYKQLLTAYEDICRGTVSELAQRFNMDSAEITGFIDGINSSLKNEIDLESLEEDTPVVLEIDFEKLYYNMHKAKAPWLYELEAWDAVLSNEKRQEIAKQYRVDGIYHAEKKIGRNEPCPCGSGKKYKNCCGKGK